VYYFTITHAHEEGLRAVDFTVSYPFFHDGVYAHKRSWGAGVYPDADAGNGVYFFHVGRPEAAARFYARSPVIVHANGGLWGAAGSMHAGESAPATDHLMDRLRAPGLDGLLVFTPHSEAPVEMPFTRAGMVTS
jgi:hypothetical protein